MVTLPFRIATANKIDYAFVNANNDIDSGVVADGGVDYGVSVITITYSAWSHEPTNPGKVSREDDSDKRAP